MVYEKLAEGFDFGFDARRGFDQNHREFFPAGAAVERFLLHLRRSPSTALNLLGEMSQRLRRANENIVSLALQDVEVRLVKTLARLARDEGSTNPDGSLILRRRPTQQELANMVGSSRETVSRTLAAMARQGLTVTRGRSLLLTERLLRRGQATAQA